jgi:hypothetical protein
VKPEEEIIESDDGGKRIKVNPDDNRPTETEPEQEQTEKE